MAYISFDPFHQKEIARYQQIDDLQLENIVSEVVIAWNRWKETPLSVRTGLFKALSENLITNRSDYATMMTREMGKPISQSLSEIDKCALLCNYYADNSEKILKSEIRSSSAKKSIIRYEPQGIILGIMPWNFPFWQVFRFMIPALAGGNAVLLKHASNVPGCALIIENAMLQAGFQENIVRNLFVSHGQIERVVRKNEVRGVSITGSNIAGERVGEIAGRHNTRAVMELGGSDPFIIMSDADVDSAVEAFVQSRFLNSGQSCIAAKRLFLHIDIYDSVIEKIKLRLKELTVGDPMDEKTFFGPMFSVKAATEIERQVNESVRQGATIAHGGRKGIGGEAFFEPTIITNAPANSPVLAEEVFGPVIPVTSFKTVEEAVILANNTVFGLGAAVWSSDVDSALKIAEQIDTGTVAINGFVKSDPSVPFGGVKESGYGRELSSEGIREFVNIKTINIF